MSSDLNFNGKVVIVTGAGGGLGREYALFFASRGASVLVNDIGVYNQQKAADLVVSEIRSNGGKAVANYDSVEHGRRIVDQAMATFGTVDILINNAGILRDKSFKAMTDQEWDLVQRIHVYGAYQVTNAVWPILLNQKFGRIVNIVSAAGIYGNYGQANYSSAKLALHGLTMSLAREGEKKNVFVNSVAPLAASKMTETIMPRELLDMLKPEFISPLVAYLSHHECHENGGLFEAGAGFMAKLRRERSKGVLFRADNTLTPAVIASKWNQLGNFTDAQHPASAMETNWINLLELAKNIKIDVKPVDELRFDGKVAVITGAGRGLGRAYALAFAKYGAHVVVNDVMGPHGSSEADKVVKEIKDLGGTAIASYDSVENGEKIIQTVIAKFGRVDILVNNAGVLRDKSFLKMTDDEWEIVQRIHLNGTFKVTRAAWPYMLKQGYGRIVNTTSAVGLYGNFGQANYAAAKAAIIAFSNTLALEGKKYNIFVNSIAPNAGTAMTATIMPSEMVEALKPEYVAPFLCFLAHDKNQDTGCVYECGAGWISQVRWQRSGGYGFPVDSKIQVNDVKAKWNQICTFEDGRASYPSTTQESFMAVQANFENVSKRKNEKKNAINWDQARKMEFKEHVFEYTEKDVILYALGVGATRNDLDLVYENNDKFKALPIFGVIPAFDCLSKTISMADFIPNFDPMMLLHGEQYLEVLNTIPTSGSLISKGRIVDIIDKGKAAAVVTAVSTYDTKGNKIFENEFTSFIRGSGGFGTHEPANRKPAAISSNNPPSRPPDNIITEKVRTDQAALYRLSGDYNPLHIDPMMSQIAGFETPILHGLCTLGIATKHVFRTYCDSDISKFKSVKARFSKHVFPGETIETRMWKEGNKIIFVVRVVERDVLAITNAAVEIANGEKKTVGEKREPERGPEFNAKQVFERIKKSMQNMNEKSRKNQVEKLKAVFAFHITKGDQRVLWFVDMKNGLGDVRSGEPPTKADVTVTVSDDNFMDLTMGKLNPQKAFMQGKIKVKGNIGLATYYVHYTRSALFLMLEIFNEKSQTDYITFDTSLPWDEFLSREIYINIHKRKLYIQRSALHSLTIKLKLSKIDESHRISDDKILYSLFKHLIEISRYGITKSWPELYSALHHLVSVACHESENAFEHLFVKNCVKYIEKYVNNKQFLSQCDAASAYHYGIFIIEFFKTVIQLSKNSNFSESSTFTDVMGFITQIFQNTAIKNLKLFKLFSKVFNNAFLKKNQKIEVIEAFSKYSQTQISSTNAKLDDVWILISVLNACGNHEKIVSDMKDSILDFYAKTILSSKVSIPQVALVRSFIFHDNAKTSLHRHIRVFLDQSTFGSKIFPVFEKLLLRSPEVALFVFSHLAQSVDVDFGIQLDKIADGLLNQLKSTKEEIREVAASCFASMAEKSQNTQVLLGPANSAMKFIGSKAYSTEQKLLAIKALRSCLSSNEATEMLLNTLPDFVAKETNEIILEALITEIYPSCLKGLPDTTKDSNKISKFLSSGISVSSPSKRSFYSRCLQASGRKLMTLIPPNEFRHILVSVMKITSNAVKAGISLADSAKKDSAPMTEVMYCYDFLLQMSDSISDIDTLLLSNGVNHQDILSFLVNEKYYSKVLVKDEHLEIFIGILFSRIESFTYDGDVVSKAIVHCLAESPNWKVRINAHKNLKNIVSDTASWSKLQEYNIRGIQERLLFLEASKFTSKPAAQMNNSANSICRLFKLLRCIIPKPDVSEELKQDVMRRLSLISCNPAFIAIYGIDCWVQLCYQFKVNPHQLVQDNFHSLFEAWTSESIRLKDSTGEAKRIALSIFVELSPQNTLNEIVPWMIDVLSLKDLQAFSGDDMMVWQTPEGTLYHNPLLKKGSNQKSAPIDPLAKFSKPSDQKLSKQDKELTHKQLEAEKAIRQSIQVIVDRVQSGLGLLNSILDLFKNRIELDSTHDEFYLELDKYVGVVLKNLLFDFVLSEMSVRSDKKQRIFIQTGLETLNKLFRVFGYRFNTITSPLNVLLTTFLLADGFDTDYLDSYLSNKSLSENIELCLRTIKESHTPSNPLSAGHFALILPLLRLIIFKSESVRLISEKKYIDLVLDTADIIFAHPSLGSTNYVERNLIAECIIELVEKYPRCVSKGRECLIALSSAVGSSQNSEEEEPMELIPDSLGNNPTQYTMVIVDGLIKPSANVRTACLESLLFLEIPTEAVNKINTRVWVLQNDENEEVSSMAAVLWNQMNPSNIPFDKNSIDHSFLDLMVLPYRQIQDAVALSLKRYIEQRLGSLHQLLSMMYSSYEEAIKPPVPQYDEYGIMIKAIEKTDDHLSRIGLAVSLSHLAVMISENTEIVKFYRFLIESRALGDKNEEIRKEMLRAGLNAISSQGRQHQSALMLVFESYLAKSADNSVEHDNIRENVVILVGSIARHMNPQDKKVPRVIDQLIETLKTPSETVQMAVSECLSSLVKIRPDLAAGMSKKLIESLLTSEKYGERRGAAYGLSGVVRGKGVTTLKEFGILDRLKQSAEDKKNPRHREGAMLAYETLSYSLGRLFEPFVIRILPLLLLCYGDGAKDVRQATDDACRVIMSKLSGHCLKLLLPSVLNGLQDEDSWRTKASSVEVLGAMASLAPKQLSLSLPKIIPRLCEVLTDSHYKVVDAAKAALENFGHVIKNPEISSLVSVIIDALVDPNEKTEQALTALLDTAFVHYIDTPSLALVVPILQRGLRERSTETKRKAAQIMGNMSSLTEHKDLIPYLPVLVPNLKEVLVDPSPVARATAAKALGVMVEKLGEENFPTIFTDLINILKSDSSAVDRSGAAQGITELLLGLGIPRLEGFIPEIISNCASPKTHVREGYINLLVFLPLTFRERLAPYLGKLIPCVLKGLADESDLARETALKAGQTIVRNYATTSINLLLPELQVGLFNDNFRIRHCSVQLIGELLYRIAGIVGQSEFQVEAEVEVDEPVGTEKDKQAIIDALGIDRYQAVLSCMYMLREDSNAMVRQSSIHVWKNLVSNTPRTIKEIFQSMMKILISSLSDESLEKRGIAARTLGSLVMKMGETILHRMTSILEECSNSQKTLIREGVCLAISEIIPAAGKHHVQEFATESIGFIQKGLVDEEEIVREAAAQAFDSIHKIVGGKIVDDLVKNLLEQLQNSKHGSLEAKYALEGLKQIMAVKSHLVFPVLIPTLIQSPITSFNASALSSLLSVAGNSLWKKIPNILPALIVGLEQEDDAVANIRDALKSLFASIDEYEGVHTILSILSDMSVDANIQRIHNICDTYAIFFSETNADIEDYVNEYIHKFVSMLHPTKVDNSTIPHAWAALDSLTKKLKKEDMENYVVNTRKSIKMYPEEKIVGFNTARGIAPLLPIFLQGLIYASSDIREQAAYGLGDLVRRTNAESLKPFVTQIVGPLIRISGDRISVGLKSAILETVGDLLREVPLLLKPFVPQLQRIFIKNLMDADSDIVREEAQTCLSLLIPLQPKLDVLVSELCQGIRNIEDSDIRLVLITSLSSLLNTLPKEKIISQASKSLIADIIMDFSKDSSDEIMSEMIICAKYYCRYVGSEKASEFLKRANLSIDSIED